MTKHKNDPTKDSTEEIQSETSENVNPAEKSDGDVETTESEEIPLIEHDTPEIEISALKADLETAKDKVDENWNLYLRANADLENARRRAQQDIEKARKYGLEKLVEDLLPIKDSIEMGLVAAQTENANLEKLQEGSELILKMFADTLDKHGIETVEPKGETFDPERHQAMSLQESEDEPNTVISVLQKGYLLNGRLIRPAMVIVAKKPTADTQNSTENDGETVGTNVDEKA